MFCTKLVNVQELWITSRVVNILSLWALDADSNPEGGFILNTNCRGFALILKNTPITGTNFVKSVDFWMYFWPKNLTIRSKVLKPILKSFPLYARHLTTLEIWKKWSQHGQKCKKVNTPPTTHPPTNHTIKKKNMLLRGEKFFQPIIQGNESTLPMGPLGEFFKELSFGE